MVLDDEVVRSHTLVAVAVGVGELARNRCSFVVGGSLLVVAVAFEYIQVGYYMHKAAAAAAACCCCRIAWIAAAVPPYHSCCCCCL